MKESLLYFIAAALFALAATIHILSGREMGVAWALYAVVTATMIWLGLRSKRRGL